MLAEVVAAAGEPEVPAVPPVGQPHPDRVRSEAELGGDVVGLVAQPMVVAGPSWREHLVADRGAVQLGVVDAVGGGVQPGVRDRLVQHEVSSQHDNRLGGRIQLRQRRLHQCGGPVGGLEQPGLDDDVVAPGRGFGVADAPDPDPDRAPVAAGQRRRVPRHQHRFVRVDPAGRPHRPGRLVRRFDLDLVGRLSPTRQLGGGLPGHPRAALTDAERLPVVLDRDGQDGQVAHTRSPEACVGSRACAR